VKRQARLQFGVVSPGTSASIWCGVPGTGVEPVFTQLRNGGQWDRHSASERFRAIRERAGVRQRITIYSFRHLRISEMLMAGVECSWSPEWQELPWR
jgi:integrase